MRGLWNHLGLYVAEGLWNGDMENVRYDYFFQFYVYYSWDKKVLGANSLANQIIEVKKIKKVKFSSFW